MFIVVQIPLVDLRRFIGTATGRIRSPGWPTPNVESEEFVRGFGVTRKRLKGDIHGIPGDVYYVEAGRALRFPVTAPEGDGGSKPPLRPVYRRLFVDGRVSARMELAFALNADVSIPQLLETIEQQLTSPVRISQQREKAAREEKSVPLRKSGRALASAYLHATTKHEYGAPASKNWVVSGEPTVFVERGAHADAPEELTDALPVSVLFQPGAFPGANTKKKQAGSELTLSLSSHLVVVAKQAIAVWIATAAPGVIARDRRAAGRIVRGHVLRIHAEIESFKAVLRAISQQVLAPDGTINTELDLYLRDAAKLLLSESKRGFNRGILLDDLEKSTQELPIVDRKTLELTMHSLPSLSAKTREWLETLLASSRLPPAAPETAPVVLPPLILLLSANPQNTERLRLDIEARSIELAIRQREPRLPLRLETRWAVRVDDLIQAMLEMKPMILHFSGHGDENGLSFESDGDEPQYVDGTALAALLDARDERPTLVLLNACYSSVQAAVIANVVDYVIAMRTEISDDAAIIYTSTLYQTLCFDPKITNAHQMACAALVAKGFDDEKSTPELFIRPGVSDDVLH